MKISLFSHWLLFSLRASHLNNTKLRNNISVRENNLYLSFSNICTNNQCLPLFNLEIKRNFSLVISRKELNIISMHTQLPNSLVTRTNPKYTRFSLKKNREGGRTYNHFRHEEHITITKCTENYLSLSLKWELSLSSRESSLQCGSQIFKHATFQTVKV